MKHLIVKSIVLICISVSIVNILMILIKDDYSLHSNEINVSLSYKRLDSLNNKNKIIIIAGSNGSWGMNSQILSDSFNIPVVNTSTHAGIGVRMQFEMYKRFMKCGDIVIFCPEYYRGENTLYGESTLLRVVSTHVPQEYLHFSIGQWIHVYKYMGIHFKECLVDKGMSAGDGPYSSSAVNEYGDIDCNRKHENFSVEYTIKGKMDNKTLKYYKYIFDYTKAKGINLIYLPPTFMESNYRNQKKQIDSLSYFMNENKIPYQASSKRYMFGDSMYCNTPYHMTSEGAKIRTLKVIEDIKKILVKKY